MLIDKLNQKGTKEMAESYLNCRHKKLHDAEEDWAYRHGYSVFVGYGSHPVGWGSW